MIPLISGHPKGIIRSLQLVLIEPIGYFDSFDEESKEDRESSENRRNSRVNSFTSGWFECVLTMVTSPQWRTLISTSEAEVPCTRSPNPTLPRVPLSSLICRFSGQNMSNATPTIVSGVVSFASVVAVVENSTRLPVVAIKEGRKALPTIHPPFSFFIVPSR